MQRHISALACAAAMVVAASSQLTRAQQPKFTSTTALLTLEVTVVDRDGNPITGLTADDFSVSLNGAKRPVRAVTFLETVRSPEASTRAPQPKGQVVSSPFAALDPENGPDPRLFVLMIDDLSIRPGDSKGLMVAAEKFLAEIPDRDAVGLTTTSGLIVVNPSHARSELMKRLKRATGSLDDPRQRKPFVGIFEALQIEDGNHILLRDVIVRECDIPKLVANQNLEYFLTNYMCANEVARQARASAMQSRVIARTQMDSYEAVIKAMAPAPGVKQLVVITGGLTSRVSRSPEYIQVAKAAAAAGVQLTMLMEEPDNFDGKLLADDQRQLLAEAQTLTDMSGGQFFRVVGQPERFYDRIMHASSAVYRIGIDLPQGSTEKTQFAVDVAVARPGAQVHASRYAAPPAPPPVLAGAEGMKRLITSGAVAYAVPVRLTPTAIKSTDGTQTAIRVVVDVPGDIPGPVSGLFGMVDAKGQLKTGKRDVPKSADGQTYHVDFIVPVPEGGYELRFAVSDATGAVGAIVTKVIVKK